MATRRQKIKVGLFLFVSFAIMVIGTIIIMGLYESDGKIYWIEFDENILGLYEGGLVEYTGVPVGKVREIRVTDDNKARVTIVIDPEKVTLREGVEAQLKIYSIAAGTMAVSLSSEKDNGDPLRQNTMIPTKISALKAIGVTAQEFVTDLSVIAKRIVVSLEGMEEGDIVALLDKVETVLDDASGFIDDGRVLIRNADGTLDRLREEMVIVTNKMTALGDDVQKLTNDIDTLVLKTTKKVDGFDAQEMQGQLSVILQNIEALTGKMNTAMDDFDEISANMLHQADNVEFNLRVTLKEMNDAMDTTRSFVEQLKQDPSSVVWGKD